MSFGIIGPQLINRSQPRCGFQVIVTSADGASVVLPAELRLDENGLGQDAVFVVSSAPIVISVINLGSCASFLNIPTPYLGYEHRILTFPPNDTTTTGNSQVRGRRTPKSERCRDANFVVSDDNVYIMAALNFQ